MKNRKKNFVKASKHALTSTASLEEMKIGNYKTFSDEFTYVIDPDLCFGRRLHEGAVAELASQVEALILADDALVLQVALVAHQHHRHVVSVLKKKKKK